MVVFEVILTAFLFFIGVAGIISTYKLDKKGQKKLDETPEAVVFSFLPLWVTKFVFYFLSLIPLIIITAMWLQKFGVIE